MKAVIRLDVPDWQIGQYVSVYFPDTMVKSAVCEEEKQESHSREECENCAMAIENMQIVRCKDCKHQYFMTKKGNVICGHVEHESEKHPADWFCADGERK